jgi:hypothetical protein
MTEADQARLIKALVGRGNVELLLEAYQQGRTHRELAQRHRISRQAVSKRLAIARGKLRSCGLWPPDWERRDAAGLPAPASPSDDPAA